MKLVAQAAAETSASEIEQIELSRAQHDTLRQISRDLNPDTPIEFGGAHAVRMLLEHFEEAGIDLSDASSEAGITELATAALRARRRR